MPKRRPWGAGEVIPPSSPGAGWSIRWRENGRRRRLPGFPTRELAQRALDAKRGDLARESAGLPVDARRLPTLATLAAGWLKRRERTHRNHADDRRRWDRDLASTFGPLTAPEVDPGTIRAWAEERRAAGLSPASVQLGQRLLSSLFTDLAERPRETGAATDPTKRLPRSLRALYRPDSDPRLVPFLRRPEDVARVYGAMTGVPALAYAVAARLGLRTGEVIGLHVEDIDLERRQVYIRQQVARGQLGPLKDKEARILPLPADLLPVLRPAVLERGGRGLLCPPGRAGVRSGPSRRPARYLRPQTLAASLGEALAACGLPSLTWYQASRHSFASQYVLAGGDLTRLSVLLGHSSPLVTQRYAHLQSQDVALADVDRVSVEFGPRTGQLVRHPAAKKRRKSLG